MTRTIKRAVLFPPCLFFGALYGLAAYASAVTAMLAALLEGVFYWLRQKMEV